MKIGVYSLNFSFLAPILEKLSERHQLKVFQNGPDRNRNLLNLGALVEWSELHFVEFAQDPLNIVANMSGGKPVIVRIHRLEVYSPYIQQVNWNDISLVIFSSEHVRDKFFSRAISRPRNTIVIPTNGVNLKKFKFVERDFDKEEVNICQVGTLIPKKRVYTTIQMMKDLPDNFKLNVIGGINPALKGYGNTEYKENLNDLVDELGLNDRVTFLGQIDSETLPGVLAQQDIIISNSNEEGTHVALAEAMATGCIPLINCWKGAGKLYPENAIFKSFKEFEKKIMKWYNLSPKKKLIKSREMNGFIKQRYDEEELTEKLITEIEKLG